MCARFALDLILFYFMQTSKHTCDRLRLSANSISRPFQLFHFCLLVRDKKKCRILVLADEKRFVNVATRSDYSQTGSKETCNCDLRRCEVVRLDSKQDTLKLVFLEAIPATRTYVLSLISKMNEKCG